MNFKTSIWGNSIPTRLAKTQVTASKKPIRAFSSQSSIAIFQFAALDEHRMDFLKSAIEAEISKKRKTLDTVASGSGSDKKKKYVSRAELERLREEEYKRQEAEREAKERERKERLRKEQEAKEEAEKRKPAQSTDKEQEAKKVCRCSLILMFSWPFFLISIGHCL
ncbi:uncharacterized protein BYT42DRAFT_273357 [Radiomyces spectabilis]|uniref:uncharacterized protein n=1 Tax=Radiomyces spectabilis TaxID=64574 RepID=UPI0022208FFE|nr:uncharacterized protein BYT42DRAFT_273357 [Radiomyces spectabilis]KAI8384759.1 hypothetical protein BYT42DRAFT_273357 [Radiomyces spectabilis]